MSDSNQFTLSLRSARQEDIPFLRELRDQTMRAHIQASSLEHTDEDYLRRVLFRFECAEIIQLQGHPIGLLKLARDGSNWELIQIQIGPDLQGQGIGVRLIKGVIDEANDAGAILKLSVLKKNPARRLYERLGFLVVTETDHSYEMRYSK